MFSFLAAIIGSTFFSATAFAQQTQAFSQQPFSDVPTTSKYYEAVEYLRSHNVLKGYPDGTFKADTRINRAEFAQLAINPFLLDTNNMSACIAENISESSNTVFFSDVAKDAWYATHICFAKIRSLVDGYPDGTYRPADSINFVEAAKIISNIFTLDITNVEKGEFWYRPYVKRLSDLHAIPVSIKHFDQIMTRGEISEIMYRLKADREDKTHTTFSAIR